LKTVKYKCPKCKYTWSTEKKPCGGCSKPGCGCASSCDSGCATSCDSGYAPAPTQAWQPVPQVDYQQSVSGGLETTTIDSQRLPAPSH
jgi:hypothetical protein